MPFRLTDRGAARHRSRRTELSVKQGSRRTAAKPSSARRPQRATRAPSEVTGLSPSIADLPAPTADQQGWPWTETSPAPSEDGADWPLVSIVTPSYNQGAFIEKTMRSVLLQGYPRLEYIVMDGGSNDGSVETIRRYERWLTYWTSAKDDGQSAAINQGLRHASGEIFNWVNSDDFLAPGALFDVAREWRRSHAHVISGRGLVVTACGDIVHDWTPRLSRTTQDFLVPKRVVFSQPSTFLSRETVLRLGLLRDDLHYVMDWELYFRMARVLGCGLRTASLPRLLSYSLSHEAAKTTRSSAEFPAEGLRVLREVQPQFGWRNRLTIERLIRRTLGQQMVVRSLSDSPGSIAALARVAKAYPDMLATRFFWGAVRRVALRRR